MSNYQAIREVIKRISGQENVFTVPRIYVDLTGDLTTAVLLNQIVFLSDKSKRNDGYFYKTYKEWKEEICLTERQVRHSVNKLKKMDLVETSLKKANGSPTVHYKLDYDKLVESILTKCQIPNLQNVGNESDKMSESLTETTTEKTTENTTEKDYSEKIKTLFPHFESINDFTEINNEYWNVVSETRKTGKIKNSVIYNNMSKWTKYDPVVIEFALKCHIKEHAGKKEEYTIGIMRNTSKEEAERGLLRQPVKNKKSIDWEAL